MAATNIERVRPLRRQTNQLIFEEWAAIAEDTTCFATQILDWCVQEHPTNGWNGAYKMVYIALLRHIAEQLDSLPQAILNRQIADCRIGLRALLEAAMSLLFILEDDSERRAEAYLYMDTLRSIKRRDMQDDQTQTYKEYDLLHITDLILGPGHASISSDLESLRRRQDSELNLLRTLPNAGPEYERLRHLPKNDRPKHIEWYMFFSKIRSIRQMAVKVRLGASYDFLYTRYSGKVHPVDIIQDAIIHDQTKGVMIAIPLRSVRNGREATAVREIVAISSKCAMLCFAAYSERFLPSHKDEITGWWREHSADQKALSDKIPILSDL